MNDPITFFVGMFVLGLLLTLAVLATAVILRAAVGLSNKAAGRVGTEDAVPEPSLGKAICLAVVLVVIDVAFVFVEALGWQYVSWSLNRPAAPTPPGAVPFPRMGFLLPLFPVLLVPLSLYLKTLVLASHLPTTPRRAFGVTLWNLLISAALSLVVFAILAIALR